MFGISSRASRDLVVQLCVWICWFLYKLRVGPLTVIADSARECYSDIISAFLAIQTFSICHKIYTQCCSAVLLAIQTFIMCHKICMLLCCMYRCLIKTWCRADSRLAPSQWETALQSNAVFHWLDANLESALARGGITASRRIRQMWVNSSNYLKSSRIRRIKSQHLNVCRLVLQLSFCPIHWSQVLNREWRSSWGSVDMPQLQLSDQQIYWLLRWVLY